MKTIFKTGVLFEIDKAIANAEDAKKDILRIDLSSNEWEEFSEAFVNLFQTIKGRALALRDLDSLAVKYENVTVRKRVLAVWDGKQTHPLNVMKCPACGCKEITVAHCNKAICVSCGLEFKPCDTGVK